MRLVGALCIVLTAAALARAQPATEIAQVVSLQQAARAGIVDLSAKGDGFDGDHVAVELQGVRIPGAPVVMTLIA